MCCYGQLPSCCCMPHRHFEGASSSSLLPYRACTLAGVELAPLIRLAWISCSLVLAHQAILHRLAAALPCSMQLLDQPGLSSSASRAAKQAGNHRMYWVAPSPWHQGERICLQRCICCSCCCSDIRSTVYTCFNCTEYKHGEGNEGARGRTQNVARTNHR